MHHIFLCHDVSNSSGGGIASRQNRRLPGCGYHYRFAGFPLTVLTGIRVVHILPHPELSGFHLQAAVDFLTDLYHLGAADMADPFILRKTVLYYFCESAIRNHILNATRAAFTGVGFYLGLLFIAAGIPALGFVEQMAEFLYNHLVQLFRGFAEQLFLCQFQIL